MVDVKQTPVPKYDGKPNRQASAHDPVGKLPEIPENPSVPDWKDGQDGVVVIPTVAVRIAGAPHAENGRKLAEFLVSEEGERFMAESEAAHFPVRDGVASPKVFGFGLAAAAYDQDVLSLEQVRRMLELDSCWEAQEALSRHGVWPGQSAEEILNDAETSANFRAALP